MVERFASEQGGSLHTVGPDCRAVCEQFVRAHDYDAIAAELAGVKEQLDAAYDTLDYFGHSPPYDGSQAKANQARIRDLETRIDHLRTVANTSGVRSEDMASAIYRVLSSSPMETPVSTLCAICDQIKELHPSTHPWTARAASETASKQPDKYAAHHPRCEFARFEGQSRCNCADLTTVKHPNCRNDLGICKWGCQKKCHLRAMLDGIQAKLIPPVGTKGDAA